VSQSSAEISNALKLADKTAPASHKPDAVAPGRAMIHTVRKGPVFQAFSAKGFAWHEVGLPIADLPHDLEGFRILHISDLHARAGWDPAYDDLIGRVNANPPDLIVHTGDYVDDKHDHRNVIPTVCRLLDSLDARLGSVGIMGNHDGDLLGPPLRGLKMRQIDHHRLILASGSAQLEMIGLPGVDRADLDMQFLRAIPPKQPGTIRLALCHFPDLVRKTQFLKPDIFLAGHTHGGQICLPGNNPVISHDSLPRIFVSGVHRSWGTWLVVSRGFGFSSLPIRFLCPAEVMEIRLMRGAPEPGTQHNPL
jgi:predicted MPP superfamily phosphohydrolase